MARLGYVLARQVFLQVATSSGSFCTVSDLLFALQRNDNVDDRNFSAIQSAGAVPQLHGLQQAKSPASEHMVYLVPSLSL